MTTDQQERADTFRQLSTAFLELLQAEQDEIETGESCKPASLADVEWERTLTPEQEDEALNGIRVARERMQEACMWACRVVERHEGDS